MSELETDPKSIFKSHDLHNTPQFSMKGMKTWARLVDVYDGDTVTLIIPLKGEFARFQCRLSGIDTCEMKSADPKNKETAICARNRLLQLSGCHLEATKTVTRKQIQAALCEQIVVVWISCHEFDKYGRLLVDLYSSDRLDAVLFAKVLIEEKLAYVYTGESKLSEKEQSQLLGTE